MFLRSKTIIPAILSVFLAASSLFAQDATESKPEAKKNTKQTAPTAVITAEGVAESVVVVYGGMVGRQTLNQIRKTTFERGRITTPGRDGKNDTSSYERWILRGDNLDKERIRFDQSISGSKFALVYNGEKVYGVYNDSVFTPREDASQAFQHQIFHGIEALLRYKENESKVELNGKEKILGVEFHLLDVTDKQGRKTRFYVSSKTFRVMMLEYEQAGVKYKRKFYDYNYAQGTLVPYRSVLWAGDKLVEEVEVLTVTFGQKVDEGLFRQGE